MTFSRLHLVRHVVSGFSRTGVLAIVLVATALVSAQTPAGGRDTSAASVASYALSQQMPVDPEVARRRRCRTGCAIYVRPNGKPARRAELRLVVKAGSVLEDDDQRGLAHFVEHMQFEGTRQFPGTGHQRLPRRRWA